MKYARILAFLLTIIVAALSLLFIRQWRLINLPGHGPALMDAVAYQTRPPALGETVCFFSPYNGRNRCGEITGLPGDSLDFNDGTFYVLPGTVYLTNPDSQERLGAVPTALIRGKLVARLPF
jgi:hypothetical protein